MAAKIILTENPKENQHNFHELETRTICSENFYLIPEKHTYMRQLIDNVKINLAKKKITFDVKESVDAKVLEWILDIVNIPENLTLYLLSPKMNVVKSLTFSDVLIEDHQMELGEIVATVEHQVNLKYSNVKINSTADFEQDSWFSKEKEIKLG